MNMKEFTKEELIQMIQERALDGKVTVDDLGKIIFDSRFPDSLFENAKEQIINARNDSKRAQELSETLLPKYKELQELQRQVIDLTYDRATNAERISVLKKKIEKIEIDIKPLDKEFMEIASRIKEREKK